MIFPRARLAHKGYTGQRGVEGNTNNCMVGQPKGFLFFLFFFFGCPPRKGKGVRRSEDERQSSSPSSGYRSSGSNRQQQQQHGGPVFGVFDSPTNRTSPRDAPPNVCPPNNFPPPFDRLVPSAGGEQKEQTNQRAKIKEKRRTKKGKEGKKARTVLPLSQTAASRESSMNATNKVQTILCMVSLP